MISTGGNVVFSTGACVHSFHNILVSPEAYFQGDFFGF